jgi:hypothetical protein
MKRGLVVPVALAVLGLVLARPLPCRGEDAATLKLANDYIYDAAPGKKAVTKVRAKGTKAPGVHRPAVNSSAAVRNQPVSVPISVPASVPAATPAVETPPAPVAVASPGQVVVGPGTGAAPSTRVGSGPAPARAAAKTFPFSAVLMAVLGLSPALGWIWAGRSRREKARPRHSAPEDPPSPAAPRLRVLRRAAEVEEAPEAPAEPVALKARPDPAPEVAPRGLGQLRASIRRAAEKPAPPAGEIESLRSEVLEGLRQMKRSTVEFTDALDAGRSELQSELARAQRALDLLRTERTRLEEAVDRARAELSTSSRPAPRPAARPVLNPAWLSLADESDGLVVPPVALQEPPTLREAPRPDSGAPVGAAAVRALAARGARSVPPWRSSGSGVPPERRRTIVNLAREGRSVEQIARDLKLGRGEVTLALARAV